MKNSLSLFVLTLFIITLFVGCSEESDSIFGLEASSSTKVQTGLILPDSMFSNLSFYLEKKLYNKIPTAPTLADTIVNEWLQSEGFMIKFEKSPHPSVRFEDSLSGDPYGNGSIIKFYFNNELYLRYGYVPVQWAAMRPPLYGGWINPNTYLLAICTYYNVHGYASPRYDYYVLRSVGPQTTIQLLPKTQRYGYYTNAIFELEGLHMSDVTMLNDNIYFHGHSYYPGDALLSRFSVRNIEFVNCYATTVYPYTTWTWQW